MGSCLYKCDWGVRHCKIGPATHTQVAAWLGSEICGGAVNGIIIML